MSGGVLVAGSIAAALLIWVVAIVNRFVRLRNHLRESWAGIDVELKRRYELIPNLVETVKGYARHEEETLERVVRLRQRAVASTGSPATQGHDETALLLGLERLFALAEAYPELRADRHFLELQRHLALTEDRIAAARRFYNGNVRTLNVLRESFPTSLVARMLGVEPASYFEVEERAERVVPRVEMGG